MVVLASQVGGVELKLPLVSVPTIGPSFRD